MKYLRGVCEREREGERDDRKKGAKHYIKCPVSIQNEEIQN